MPRYTPHERTVAELRSRGLIDDQNNLTPAGHEWTRALIARMDAKEQRNARKLRRKREQEEQARAYDRAVG